MSKPSCAECEDVINGNEGATEGPGTERCTAEENTGAMTEGVGVGGGGTNHRTSKEGQRGKWVSQHSTNCRGE